jgi:hypothetical protein
MRRVQQIHLEPPPTGVSRQEEERRETNASRHADDGAARFEPEGPSERAQEEGVLTGSQLGQPAAPGAEGADEKPDSPIFGAPAHAERPREEGWREVVEAEADHHELSPFCPARDLGAVELQPPGVGRDLPARCHRGAMTDGREDIGGFGLAGDRHVDAQRAPAAWSRGA